jgi:CRISPR-associated endoribonuclease Cas6
VVSAYLIPARGPWATILARREMGESLQIIAEDLEIPYTTAKTYVKLARRMLKDMQSNV